MNMTNNRFQPLANFSDTPVITSGKKKATSLLQDEQETMKRLIGELKETRASIEKTPDVNDLMNASANVTPQNEQTLMDNQPSDLVNINDVNDDVINVAATSETTEGKHTGQDTLTLDAGVIIDSTEPLQITTESMNSAVA